MREVHVSIAVSWIRPAGGPAAMRVLVALVVCIAGGALRAQAQPQDIDVRPSSVDFGRVEVGQSSRVPIDIHNVGGLPLAVDRLTVTHPGFSVAPQGPFTVGRGQVWRVDLVFTARDPGRIDADLAIDSNDPDEPRVIVPLSGIAVSPPPPPPPPLPPQPRVAFVVEAVPFDVRATPGKPVPFVLMLRETARQSVRVRGGPAFIELADGTRLAVPARSFDETLAANGVRTLDDRLVVPEAFFDAARRRRGQAMDRARYVRTFIGGEGADALIVEANVLVQVTGPIGADFAVMGLTVEFPIDGAVLGTGATLRATARVTATGSGSVTGAWIVDGARVEIFSADVTGGRPATLAMRLPAPTMVPGLHELVLEVSHPGSLRSRPVRYLVTAASHAPMRWLLPEGFRVYLRGGQRPEWSWTPVAAAVAYVVRLDGTDVDRTRETRWTLPAPVRDRLATGTHSVEIEAVFGATDAPALMDARVTGTFELLDRPSVLDAREENGTRVWTGPTGEGLFLVTVALASDGAVSQRTLTRQRRLGVDDAEPLRMPGSPHEWWVEALNDHGEPIAVSVALRTPASQR